MRQMLIQDGNEWSFPKFNSDEVDDEIESVLDCIRSDDHIKVYRAMFTLEMVIEDNPNNIEALHHLAIIYDHIGLEKKAFHYWEDSVRAGKNYFPKKFILGKSLLSYREYKNRPFLRSYHALGLSCWKLGDTDKAIKIFEELLGSCPNDNLGCRLLLPLFYFINKDYDSAINVTKQYLKNNSFCIYNYALAHFLKGDKTKGMTELKKAVIDNNYILDRLLDRGSKTVEMIYMGPLTESMEYFDTYGSYWKSCTIAMEAVRSLDS